MDYRALHGEQITPDSWLMRNMWRTMDVRRGRNCGRIGLATRPKKLEYEGLKKVVNRALWDTGLRHPLPEGQRRHEWKQDHGYRKYFKTRAEQVMNHSNVELLMGRPKGLQGSYYKPSEQEVLTDYRKAIDSLTVNNEAALEKQVSELTQENQQKDYVIKTKLAEKEMMLAEKEKIIAQARQEVLQAWSKKRLILLRW